MLISTAYIYRANYICSECIAQVITKDKPWSAWAVINNLDKYPADRALRSIAGMLGVNPDSEQSILDSGFPHKQSETPDPPTFCVSCLKWFS